MAFKEQSAFRCFGGMQQVLSHDSEVLGCRMNVGVYLPPGAEKREAGVLIFLSGLTCTEQNVITKSGIQRYAAEHGLILICPDTSPRGKGVADDPAWDLGMGAGFYVDATQAPWSEHYRMDAYVTREMVALARDLTDNPAISITGHSMGGHGALTLALRNPGMFRSVSALAPILEPSQVPWGQKAFGAYLGSDKKTWAAYDASLLVLSATERLPLLIDQGTKDPFLTMQLSSSQFREACVTTDHPLMYRLQGGYGHGYYFVSTFIGDHVAWHAKQLNPEG